MSRPVGHRHLRSLAIVAAVVALSGCTSAGAPAAGSPAAATTPVAAISAAQSSAAPTLAPTPAPTPPPPAVPSASVAPSAGAAAPSASKSSGGGGYGDNYGGYGATTSGAPTASAASAGGSLGTATISGIGTVLTGADGRTLYTYKPDTAGTSACDGGCAKAWPPMAATTAPGLPSGATGKVTLITRGDGSKQVAYDGHPLYAYSGDMGPGEANGQGLGGVWSVAKP